MASWAARLFLDSHDDTNLWATPRLIIQLYSLLNLVYKSSVVMDGKGIELSYDFIVLDESLMSHFDEGTMHRKEIEIWFFFHEIMHRLKNIVLMDGDIKSAILEIGFIILERVYM